MKTSKLFRMALCGLALFASVNLWAQDRGPGRGARGGIEGLVQQLELTDEQKESIKAVLAESREARKAILAEHGVVMEKGERPDREKMKEAQPQMAALRKETEAKVKALLTEEQLAALAELRAKGGEGQGGEKKKKKADDET